MNERINNNLKARSKAFLFASGTPITKMCARVGMATSSYYRWQRGLLNLSIGRLTAIDYYLKEFGF